MATKVADLFVEVGVRMKNFSKGMQNMQRSLRDVADDMKNVGMNMSAAITIPLVGIAAASLKTAGSFEAGMNKVKAVSQTTGQAFQALRGQAEVLGRTTQFTATQASEAMGFLAMAGFKANDILSAMPSTLQLAASAAIDLGTAADITSNILTGYGIAVEDLGHANDVLVTGFTKANVDLRMMGDAFKYVGPVARGAGLAFEETAAAIALLGNAGIQGSMAGTTLRRAITALLAPTKEGAKLMKKFGISALNAQGTMKDFASIVEDLEKSTISTGEMMTLFGQRAGPGMQALVDQGADSLRKLRDEMEKNEGIAKRVSETMMQGWRGAMLKLKSAAEGTLIAIGDSLIPIANKVAEALTSIAGHVTTLAKVFGALPQPIQTLVIALAGLAAALGPAIFIMGHFLGAAANLRMLGPTLASAGASLVKFGASARSLGAARIALTALTSAARVAVPGLIALGVVLAGLAAVKVATGIKRVVDAIRWSGDEAGESAGEVRKLEDALKSVEDRQREMHQEILATAKGFDTQTAAAIRAQRASENWGRWWDELKWMIAGPIGALRNLGAHLDKLGETIELLKGKFADGGDIIVKQFDKITGALMKQTRATADAHMEIVLRRREAVKLQAAQEKLLQSTNGLTKAEEQAAKAAERRLKAWEQMQQRYEQAARSYVDLIKQIQQMDKEIVAQQRNLAASFQKSHEQIQAQALKTVDIIEQNWKKRLPEAIQAAIRQTEELAASFQRLGVQSSEQLTRLADQADRDFDLIAEAYTRGRTTYQDVFQAYVKMKEAQIAAARASGESIEELTAEAEAAKDSLLELGIVAADTSRQTSSELGQVWKQISTIFTDMSSGIADVIWEAKDLGEVFTGTFRQMGKALTRFIIEDMTKGLVASIYQADSALQALSKSFMRLFGGLSDLGGAAGAAKGAKGAGKDAEKGAGMAGLAMAGPIGAIMALAQLATELAGYFQGRRMEKDLGRIEVTSREIKNIAIHTLERANEFWPWLEQLKFLGSIDKRSLRLVELFEKGIPASEDGGGKPNLSDYLEEVAENLNQLQQAAEKATEASGEETAAKQEAAEASEQLTDATRRTTDAVFGDVGARHALDDAYQAGAEAGKQATTAVNETAEAMGNAAEAAEQMSEGVRKQVEALGGAISDVQGTVQASRRVSGEIEFVFDTMEKVGNKFVNRRRKLTREELALFRKYKLVSEDTARVLESSIDQQERYIDQTESAWDDHWRTMTRIARATAATHRNMQQSWRGLTTAVASGVEDATERVVSSMIQMSDRLSRAGVTLTPLPGPGGRTRPGIPSGPAPGISADIFKDIGPPHFLNLQVTVNNADARQIADEMIGEWRRRGVDI